MASSYDNDLRLEEQASGENATTWGDKTNNNLELIAEAFSYGTRAIANASTDTITIANGTSDADRSLYLKLTGGGQACTVTLAPDSISKVWVMENATSFTLTFNQGTGGSVANGRAVAVPAGDVKVIATDGAEGSAAVVHEVFTDLNVGGLTLDKNDDGATAAPILTLNRTSASPADNDNGGIIRFDMENDNNQQFIAASVFATALDVSDGTEDGQLSVQTMKAGTLTTAASITNEGNVLLPTDGAVINFGADSDVSLTHVADTGLTLSAGANLTTLKLTSTEAGGSAGPKLELFRDSASPAASDVLGVIDFKGENPSSGEESYAEIKAVITEITDTEEDSKLVFSTMVAGSSAENLTVDNTSVKFKVDGTAVANQGFAEDTKMVFYQSSAPTGWTIDSSQNNKALRVVSSSGGNTGGSVAFTTAFANGNTGGKALTTANLPAHTHNLGTTYDFITQPYGSTGMYDDNGTSRGVTDGAAISTSSVGSGTTHNHSLTLAVQYCDVMICVKGA